MRQKAVVLETKDTIARIKVLRSSMCEGCEKRGSGGSCACGELMGANRVMIAEAVNEIGAKPGEDVEIETESTVVLGYAALVFLMPIAAFFLGYALTDYSTQTAHLSWIVGIGCFLLSFVPIMFLEHRRRGKSPQIRIVARVKNEKDELFEDIE